MGKRIALPNFIRITGGGVVAAATVQELLEIAAARESSSLTIRHRALRGAVGRG
jgi:hypothetical protein